MLTNLSRNVVYVKDIPSNIIEEAFFILKNNGDEKNSKIKKEIAMSEINDILIEYTVSLNNEKEKAKEKIEAEKQLKKTKVKATLCIFAFIISCIIMAIIHF